jgi:hypothetical protein
LGKDSRQLHASEGMTETKQHIASTEQQQQQEESSSSVRTAAAAT